MRIVLFIISILHLSFLLSAQESSLNISSNIGLFNNSINEQLLSESYGFLDNTEKNNIIDGLKPFNYIQFELDNELKYKNRKGWGLLFGNHAALYSSYSKPLAELILFGNAPFKGEQLKLSPFQLNAYHYSKLEVFYQWHPKFTTSISFIGGHQMAIFDVKNAVFTTGESGSSVAYEIDFEGHHTDTTDLRNNLFKLNGKGAALGFTYTDSIGNGSYIVSIQDLGFIKWDETTNNRYVNSSWSFEGINVDDFIAFNDSLLTSDFDSLQNVINEVKKERFTWRLPTTLAFSTIQKTDLTYVDGIRFSVIHKSGIYELPRVSLDMIKSFKKHEFSLGYHIGGFERPGFQFGYGFISKKMTYSLFTKQANSIIPSQNYGLHLSFGIKRVFSTSK
ncbi:MAG: DUF5723 family protein [Flavobacteriales bacterium]